MKRSVWFALLVVAVIFLLCFPAAQSLAGEKACKMAGEIAAIDLGHNTVVIEVPVGGRLFTVGGPLSPGAVLNKGFPLSVLPFLSTTRPLVSLNDLGQRAGTIPRVGDGDPVGYLSLGFRLVMLISLLLYGSAGLIIHVLAKGRD